MLVLLNPAEWPPAAPPAVIAAAIERTKKRAAAAARKDGSAEAWAQCACGEAVPAGHQACSHCWRVESGSRR